MSRTLDGLRIAAAIAFTALVMAAVVSFASRNSAGTMAAVSGPYTPGTVINSAVVNARLADIESEITDSLSRSGKGGMTAALKTPDGSVSAPAHSFSSETNSGLYRAGASDLRMSVAGTDKVFFGATGLGIGGAPVNPLDITSSGSATTQLGTWLQPSLGDGNQLFLDIGKGTGTALSGQLAYIKNATAVNSTFCMGMSSVSSNTLCVDGNNKTIIGGGTGIAQLTTGVGTFNGASTATFTATVASGAKCVATRDAVGGPAGVSAAVSGTTLTVTSTVSLDTHTAAWICF